MWRRGDVVGLNLHWVVAPCHHKDPGKREEEADLRQRGVRGQFQRRGGRPVVSVRAITGPGSRGCGDREVPTAPQAGALGGPLGGVAGA